jgi:hypothetical protein
MSLLGGGGILSRFTAIWTAGRSSIAAGSTTFSMSAADLIDEFHLAKVQKPNANRLCDCPPQTCKMRRIVSSGKI